jgi:hypothetical protein
MKWGLKPVSWLFISAQILDIMTTVVGIEFFGAQELNPLGFNFGTLALKVLVSIIVVVGLERFNFSRLVLVVPVVATLPVAWNALVILAEMIA